MDNILRILSVLLTIVLPLFLLTAPSHSQDITFSYTHYPPHSYMQDGQPKGTIIDDVQKISSRASLKPIWSFHKMKAVTNILDNGNRVMCETGRAYTKERHKKWQYIPYILMSISRYTVITFPLNAKRISAHKNIQNLINDSNLKGIVARGQLYSAPVLKAIKDQKSWLESSSYTDFHSGSLVYKGRADYTITASDQWREVLKRKPEFNNMVSIELEGQYPGAQFYIVCTRATPANIIQKIGNAMRDLGFPKGPEFH